MLMRELQAHKEFGRKCSTFFLTTRSLLRSWLTSGHLHKNDLRRAFESIQDHLHRDAEIKFLDTNGEEIATEANPLAVKKGS